MQYMTKEQRAARDADFEARMQPRQLWNSAHSGTAIRTAKGYTYKPPVEKVKHRPTEAEDNAAGRRTRRRTNKALKGWRPHAKR